MDKPRCHLCQDDRLDVQFNPIALRPVPLWLIEKNLGTLHTSNHTLNLNLQNYPKSVKRGLLL